MMDLPEPLFEAQLHQPNICMVCALRPARSALRTTEREIVPLCEDCSSNWSLYGYQILKRIEPATLLKRMIAFKLRHPFQQPSWPTLWQNVNRLREWAAKMKRWM